MSAPLTPQVAQVGDRLTEMIFGPITRAQLALYAGASLDHNPIHVDIDFARCSGQPDVFAHGMLGMAQFGRMLTNWAGSDSLRSLSTRFTAIVPVGSTLRMLGVISARETRGEEIKLTLDLEAWLDDGTRVLKGHATVCTSAGTLPLTQEDP